MATKTFYVRIQVLYKEPPTLGLFVRIHDSHGVLQGCQFQGQVMRLKEGMTRGGVRIEVEKIPTHGFIYEREIHFSRKGGDLIIKEGSRYLSLRENDVLVEDLLFGRLPRFLGLK